MSWTYHQVTFSCNYSLQEIVYQSFQKNSHEHQCHASVSESRSNHEIGQSSHGGSSSVTTDILLQFTSDEAIAQQYEILDNLPADASFSALNQSEAGEFLFKSASKNIRFNCLLYLWYLFLCCNHSNGRTNWLLVLWRCRVFKHIITTMKFMRIIL